MLQNILELKGIKTLDKAQLKSVKGSLGAADPGYWSCSRSNGGTTEHFFGNQSSATAQAWVNAWSSLGWNASCTYIYWQHA